MPSRIQASPQLLTKLILSTPACQRSSCSTRGPPGVLDVRGASEEGLLARVIECARCKHGESRLQAKRSAPARTATSIAWHDHLYAGRRLSCSSSAAPARTKAKWLSRPQYTNRPHRLLHTRVEYLRGLHKTNTDQDEYRHLIKSKRCNCLLSLADIRKATAH